MKISGFSFARNAEKLYYPVVESIKSILPICDEFIIAIGKGDDDDHTRELVAQIGDPKIRIIDTVWEDRDKLKGWIHGQQTTVALKECIGDWCFYVQADEVVHENDLPKIQSRCQEMLNDREVEGLLFKYNHFWGDYDHHHVNHHWYPLEIRIIRNGLGIESWESAQSFRKNGEKLKVADVNAFIYHYGWVRPPQLMRNKNYEMQRTHQGKTSADAEYKSMPGEFDYGSLKRTTIFTGTHPAIMQERMKKMDWKHKLNNGDSKVRFKHDRFKYRLLTFIEQTFLGGRRLGGFKNYIRLKRK